MTAPTEADLEARIAEWEKRLQTQEHPTFSSALAFSLFCRREGPKLIEECKRLRDENARLTARITDLRTDVRISRSLHFRETDR